MPSKPPSVRSVRSNASERSPLLPRSDRPEDPTDPSPTFRPPPWRYPTLIALLILLPGVAVILALGFTVPAAAERYAEQAAFVRLGDVSVEDFALNGINLRVLAEVKVDAARVKNFDARMMGRLGGALLRKASTDRMNVSLYLPGYGDSLAAHVSIPPVVVDIRNGHSTTINFTAYVEPGRTKTIMAVLKDVARNQLEVIDVRAESAVKVWVGWFALGKQEISKTVRVDGLKDSPSLPEYTLGDVQVGELRLDDQTVLNANASLSVTNPYSMGLDIPPLGYQIYLPGCEPKSLVATAHAFTPQISVVPLRDIDIVISAIVASLPGGLTRVCQGSTLSPMDTFITRYIHGEDSEVFVSGDGISREDTPKWITDLLKDITVAVPFPGHALDDVVKSFSMSNVDISLPMPGANPDSPEALPLLSADIEVLVALPQAIDVDFGVSRLSAKANVSYEGALFGELDMHRWMPTSSEKVELDYKKYLKVTAGVKDAPLNVTDYSVFQKIVQKLLFGEKGIDLGIAGKADAEVLTPLGQFVIHELPAAGNITINGFPGFGSIPLPKTKDIRVAKSTKTAMTLAISASIRNPTPYKAKVPYSNLLVVSGSHILGNATVENLILGDGDNVIFVSIEWAPIEHGGRNSVTEAETLISQFVSGKNTSLTLQVHEETFPSMPALSRALSIMSVTIPMPHLPSLPPRRVPPPGGDDDDSDDDEDSSKPHFIRSATMHILSSTADFLVQNPFPHDAITIYTLNGSALYNGSVLGVMGGDAPFRVQPGLQGGTLSPRIPVEWSLDSVGYEAMMKALGGELKVKAVATCKLALGKYRMEVLYNGSEPMKAHVRL